MKELFPGKTVIGMTGGVGSGKSLVLTLLKEKYGACVLEADKVCRTLIEKEGSAFDGVVTLLGPQVLTRDGRIDKAVMA
ncbi:MAG: dephospho-CoA kinase, partial [Lachnospiraceae bacterium]|nr:dephospho-CoA kinase [Lachnospiraceae bacterium]